MKSSARPEIDIPCTLPCEPMAIKLSKNFRYRERGLIISVARRESGRRGGRGLRRAVCANHYAAGRRPWNRAPQPGRRRVAGLARVRQAFRPSLHNKPASGWGELAIRWSSRDNAAARWITTLSMGALLVLPQRYSVYQVRSGRKQPEQTTCVPGCSWQGPHPILGIPVSFLVFPMLQRTAKRPAFALCMLDCFSLIIVLPNRASTRSSGKFANHRACQYRL